MKKILAILLSAVLLLSLVACGKTETSKKGNGVPNDKKPGDMPPTDPVSKEVYDLKHNEDLVQAPFSFYKNLLIAGWDEPFEGSVEIWSDRLQLSFIIPKEGENTIDATVGYNAEDMSGYHFSFKVYLREQNAEGAEYKTIHTNLVPWSIYLHPQEPIYRCLFYNSGLLDIVEVGKTYDFVIAIYENDKVVGWGENTLTWFEDSQNFVEHAEQNEEVIK